MSSLTVYDLPRSIPVYLIYSSLKSNRVNNNEKFTDGQIWCFVILLASVFINLVHVFFTVLVCSVSMFTTLAAVMFSNMFFT